MSGMRRREFITLLGGAAVAWPLAARAQQGERMRRIGVLLSTREGDPQRRAQLAALVHRLTELGWADGRNARLDVRWTAGSADAARKYAAELVALAPDVIITDTSFDVAAVQQATRTVPIVFGGVIDPVGAGLVDSLARPGGNTTGFTAFEYAISAKWLELLAPNVCSRKPQSIARPSFTNACFMSMIWSSRERNRSRSLVSRRSRGRIAKFPAPSARARRITACDSRESSKLNLQANSSPRSKNRQIRLLERARSFSPFNGF